MKPSIFFWVVGVFAILWNGFGAYDLVMTVSNNEAYLASYTAEQVAYWQAMPWWRTALWIVGIVTALIASVLLLLRRAEAAPLFAVGPVAMAIGLIHDAFSGGFAIYGALGAGFSFVILAIAIFLTWYAYRQKRMGVLRSGRGAAVAEPRPREA